MSVPANYEPPFYLSLANSAATSGFPDAGEKGVQRPRDELHSVIDVDGSGPRVKSAVV